ncbi:glycosyltransferase [Roseovarius sp. B08]|uniref:glycosyltransferase n=1 Tax=Roseovarius sp. B08 TaxID=3449223 RepID=UPI003EDC1C7E
MPVTFFSGDSHCLSEKGVDAVAAGGSRLLEQGKVKAALGGLWNANSLRLLSNWVDAYDSPGTVYHVHGYHQTLSPSVLAALRPVASRTVMHAHDYFLACPNGAFFDFRSGETCNRRALSSGCVLRNCDKRSYAQKLWRVARQSLQNRARRRLSAGVTTILIHEGMEARLFPDGAEGPVRTIPNPVDPLLHAPLAAERNRDILYVGDIHAYKGVFLLAEAGRQAGVPVTFVGEGRDRARLLDEYPEHVYSGWQDRAGLQEAMKKARLLIAPTLGPEPFGLAPVEALLSGVPVIISDSMLLSQDINRLGMGRSFRAGSQEALAAVLRELSGNDRAVADMSQAARTSGRHLSLSAEQWCDALCDLYSKLLKDTVGGQARARLTPRERANATRP